MGLELGLNYALYNPSGTPTPKQDVVLARVDRVILGPLLADGSPDQAFRTNGEWASVGGILYTILYGSQLLPTNPSTIAKPYDTTITKFPIKGEVVELVTGPSINLNDDGLAKDLYYKPPYSIWNSVHHNAFPNFYELAEFYKNRNVSYKDNTSGVLQSATFDVKPFPLGSTFQEKSNIKNLQVYEGDVIYQGRWGHSIRFGSTVKNSSAKNPWSSVGENGDPILIIRNGQAPTEGDNWVPTLEDINKDAGSIYMCSGQAVYIQDLSNFSLLSFAETSKLQDDQVIRTTKQPISTDSISAKQQSEAELKATKAAIK